MSSSPASGTAGHAFRAQADRDASPDGPCHEGAPGEAVDPRTIEPKRVGDKTPRSRRGPAAAVAAPST
ncbi:DUF6009 family protein [Streptomyces sp. NPDC056255]|uniref:DUF6009 family protein n=1 Tax=Streptomyces sp. NPDC056255 TaxID=3345764 RepID=UPI0035D941ED